MQSPWQTFEGMSGSEAGLLLFVTCMDAMLDEEQFRERNPMREAEVRQMYPRARWMQEKGGGSSGRTGSGNSGVAAVSHLHA